MLEHACLHPPIFFMSLPLWKLVFTALTSALVAYVVELLSCTVECCSFRGDLWDVLKWCNDHCMILSGNACTGKSSTAHSEMVYPRHHGTTPERFQTAAHWLKDLASC